MKIDHLQTAGITFQMPRIRPAGGFPEVLAEENRLLRDGSDGAVIKKVNENAPVKVPEYDGENFDL